ncbi:hypothetical protein ROHU_021396 [Labeo rohita]|uniref:Uncharacterized protein n=1 Tax=Labeo rohita TaxID=84645 RepID=A0A498N4Z5_LABRO|nr:hypothetical protein ROHU_021396 [Labeo rohita]
MHLKLQKWLPHHKNITQQLDSCTGVFGSQVMTLTPLKQNNAKHTEALTKAEIKVMEVGPPSDRDSGDTPKLLRGMSGCYRLLSVRCSSFDGVQTGGG